MGVTAVVTFEVGEVSAPLMATAENLYAVLLVNPFITHEVAGLVTVQVIGPASATPLLLRAVTRYEVGVAPDPAVTEIVAFAFPATAEMVGALRGVVPDTVLEETPVLPLSARMTTGNVVPFASPVITNGDVVCTGLGVTHVPPPSVEYW